MTYPERTCVVISCNRAVRRSRDGTWVYNRCSAHVRALQTGAFGPSDRTSRAELHPPAAQLEAPARAMSRDEPEAGCVPRFDPPAHRGRPDRIPVRPGA